MTNSTGLGHPTIAPLSTASWPNTANDVINFAQFLMRLQLIFVFFFFLVDSFVHAALKASPNVCDRNCRKRIRFWVF